MSLAKYHAAMPTAAQLAFDCFIPYCRYAHYLINKEIFEMHRSQACSVKWHFCDAFNDATVQRRMVR